MALKKLTSAHIKALLVRIGSPTTGAKPLLEARLVQDLGLSRLPLLAKDANTGSKCTRILSIDMGIKNLAFCVADVTLDLGPNQSTGGIEANFHTIAWRRIDVAHEIAEATAQSITEFSEGSLKPFNNTMEADDPFHPRALARTAYILLARVLLPYEPDIILIERQRYRSGGGAAIQEWTVRVNMLEGMLWAVLGTLREEKAKGAGLSKRHDLGFPNIFDVSPARVGAFWIDSAKVRQGAQHSSIPPKAIETGPEGEINEAKSSTISLRKMSKGKVEKKAKIQLVQSWLTDSPFSTEPATGSGRGMNTNTELTFSFTPHAEETRKDLCSTASRTKRLRSPSNELEKTVTVRKLDDLADSFLQAAAWVAWELNRLEILRDRELDI
ncbi:ribonuclease H-like protein, partial [Lepidopterella palustris CBS 459.81]